MSTNSPAATTAQDRLAEWSRQLSNAADGGIVEHPAPGHEPSQRATLTVADIDAVLDKARQFDDLTARLQRVADDARQHTAFESDAPQWCSAAHGGSWVDVEDVLRDLLVPGSERFRF